MNSKSTYVYDPKSDIEVERLRERDKRTSNRRSFALDHLDLSDVQQILDVGCGDGVVGFDLQSRTNRASLVGVDIEPSILNKANSKSINGKDCGFIAGDGYQLPFRSSSFDLISCQYVLQHVSHPVQILEEMRRVAKSNARAIIFEWDDDVNFSYPYLPEELDKLFKAKKNLIHNKGGDRLIGRKLYHLLKASGWVEIDIKMIHDIWQGPEDRSKFLRGTELSLLELKPQLIESQLITNNEFELAIKQLVDYYSGDIFSVAFFFAGFGTNP